jgi:hypothetical protein
LKAVSTTCRRILFPMAEQRAESEPEDEEAGTTLVLTPEGWEASGYVAPGDDWVVRDDGSYESPDGTTRTWTPADPSGG